MSWKPVVAAATVLLVLGASGCGGDDGQGPTATTSPTATDGSSPTGPATGPATSSPTSSATGTSTPTSPALGLPEGFPAQDEVPLVSGVVTSKDGGTSPDGKVGWVLELAAAGSQQQCFDKAAAALVAAGFTKQGELNASGTRQAQFTTAKWAVIISSRADGDNCQLGYEVGQLAK